MGGGREECIYTEVSGKVLTKMRDGYSVQVNIPAESGEMGVLASHVPSIEQLKPGLVEVIEEAGGSKQFFRTSTITTQLQTKLEREED
jgi:hypothetical protein